MKGLRIILGSLAMLLIISTTAVAADFDWMPDLNLKAEADSSGFRAQLATRFHIGDAEVGLVLGNVDKPADAYMCLRLGEISNKPPEYVIKEYKKDKGKGWGVLAKNLGIKPGSKEFYALKNSQDLYGADTTKGQGKGKAKGKGKNR